MRRVIAMLILVGCGGSEGLEAEAARFAFSIESAMPEANHLAAYVDGQEVMRAPLGTPLVGTIAPGDVLEFSVAEDGPRFGWDNGALTQDDIDQIDSHGEIVWIFVGPDMASLRLRAERVE